MLIQKRGKLFKHSVPKDLGDGWTVHILPVNITPNGEAFSRAGVEQGEMREPIGGIEICISLSILRAGSAAP